MVRLRAYLPQLIVYAVIAASLFALHQRYAPIRVAGGSMRPALEHGDVVVVERGAVPARGHIVLITSGRGLFLHRVREVREDGTLVTRGDANPVDDFAAASKTDVVGRVVSVLPVGTVLQRWR